MKTHLVLLVLIATVLFVSLPLPTQATQESKERIIKRMVQKNEPLEITDIKVNGQSVSFGQNFVGEDDWMRTLVFSVKNKSNKLVLFATIDLFFPRPSNPPRLVHFYIFNGNWALQRRPPNTEERLAGIPPGETAQIEFSNQRFVDLQRFLKDVSYPNVTQVDVKLGMAIFEDDTMWSGEELRRDPQSPSSWISAQPGNSQPN